MTYALRIGTTTIENFSTYNDLLAEVTRLGLADFDIDLLPSATKVVRSMMNGAPVEIAADAPLCCDPSSETYWSM